MPMVRRILLTLLFLLFVIGACFAAFQAFQIVSEYHAGEKLYDDLQQYTVISTTAPTESNPEMSTENTENTAAETRPEDAVIRDLEYPQIDFENLLQINKDIVAWIHIDGTRISYPVVQGTDNRHYVSTLIDGSRNDTGSIFLDFRNQRDFSNRHTIVYGHNMRNGTMFHDICNYRTQAYYDEHPIGLIMTPEKNYYFEIVSGYVADLSDPAWQLEFVDDEDLLQWLNSTIERSPFVSQIQPQPGDQVITLSTCSYEFNNARFVLVGILKEG